MLTVTIIGGLVVAAINLAGDPYRAFGLVTWKRIDQCRRKDGERTSKAEMMMRGDWQVMFVGDSRAEVGLDPFHPALHGARTYNLGLSGASWTEIVHAAEAAMHYNNLRMMIVIVPSDRMWLDEPPGQDYLVSPFNPDMSMLEYRMGTLLGMQATTHAVNVLSSAIKDRNRLQRINGMLIRHADKVKMDQDHVFHLMLSGEPTTLSEQLPEHAVTLLRQLVTTAHRRGVRLILVTPPCHALVLESIVQSGAWSRYAQWMKVLCEVTAEENAQAPTAPATQVWDWAGATGLNAEPVPAPGAGRLMHGYWETVHFTKELGDVKLQAVLNDQPAENAVPITVDTVDQRLADLRWQISEYERQHPDQIERFFGSSAPQEQK